MSGAVTAPLMMAHGGPKHAFQSKQNIEKSTSEAVYAPKPQGPRVKGAPNSLQHWNWHIKNPSGAPNPNLPKGPWTLRYATGYAPLRMT